MQSGTNPNDDPQTMSEHVPETTTKATDELAHQIRMAEVIEDAARRLRGVCAHMAEDEFRELMSEIAAIAVKYEVLADLAAARVDPPAP
jgi:hypothetical protein